MRRNGGILVVHCTHTPFYAGCQLACEVTAHAVCPLVQMGPRSYDIALELWKHFKYPPEVKRINRVLLLGRHTSVSIFDAPDEDALLKITYPFSSLGIAKIAPAATLEEAVKK